VCVYGGIAVVERGGIYSIRDVALFINTWTQHCIYQEKKSSKIYPCVDHVLYKSGKL
jgi:hypothetical protein